MHQTSVCDQLSGVQFNNFGGGNHIGTDGAGWTYNINAPYTINTGGNANAHIQGVGNGVINQTGAITVTINGSPSPIINIFYNLSGSVLFNLGSGTSYPGGPATGCKQWNVAPQAWLSRGGNSIPGSVAGTPAAGSAPAAGSGWVT
jgi:hypothetical protein